MEESIKRVEKLVHATNSALAQMKYNLMFDDLGEGFEVGRKRDDFDRKFLNEKDLRLCQDEFRSETDEILAKMNKLFGQKGISHRKRSETLERIKEINKKLVTRKSDPPETQQSRQKLLALISQDLTPVSKTSEDKPPALKLEKPPTPKEPDRKSSPKSKEELKTKILETQAIVDRGFHTARQLSQKVESIAKTTPSDHDVKKSESSENLKSRCKKCAERRRTRNMKSKEVGEVKNDNVAVVEVKDARVPSLGIQRLPSLHIKDGLRLQKVHNLEIPAGDTCDVVNTANVILTHDDIEKEKREKEMDQIRFNCLFSDDRSNYFECFNCGRLNKTRETRVNPRKVDDVLRMCNFNVFDPRIDEFVERCNTGEFIQEEEPIQDRSEEQTVMEKSHRKTRKLEEMSQHLSKLYKQKTDAIGDNHLRLDNILQSLFRRVDESREMFEECCLFKRGMHRLSLTKPVTVSLDSRSKKMDKKDVKNRSKSRTQLPVVTSSESTSAEEPKVLLKVRPTFEKPKRDKIEPSTTSDVKPSKPNQKPSVCTVSKIPKRTFRKSGKLPKPKIQKTSVVKSPEIKDVSTSSSTISKEIRIPPKLRQLQDNFKPVLRKEENKNNKTPEMGKTSPVTSPSPPKAKESEPVEFQSPIKEPRDLVPETEKSLSSSGSKKPETKPASPNLEKTEDYESDFEGDSEQEANHKLSTIQEVDSEPEKKQTTPSQGTTPSELVTSLKVILSALKDQFTRTETLAEKLGENMQEKKDSPKLWPTDSELVTNLQSARRDSKNIKHFKSPFSLVDSSRNKKPDDLFVSSLSEGGSSIGEIITRRKSDSNVSENLGSEKRSPRVFSGRKNPFKLGLNDDVSYSEGEIPSNILVDSETNSARSVGEVPSEKTSGRSSIN